MECVFGFVPIFIPNNDVNFIANALQENIGNLLNT